MALQIDGRFLLTRMMYDFGNQEAFLRRKLEEQQHAAELQQAIEAKDCLFGYLLSVFIIFP